MPTVGWIDILVFTTVTGSVLWAGRSAWARSLPPLAPLTEGTVVRLPLKPTAITGATSWSERWDRRLAIWLYNAGLRWPTERVTLAAGIATLIAGGAAISSGMPLPFSLLGGSGACAVVAVGVTLFRIRRRRQLRQQFPTALELMTRAARAGESLPAILQMASASSENPLHGELHECVVQVRLGRAPQDAIEDMAHRASLPDIRLLAHMLTVHQQFGGPLADSLERLTRVIRERSAFADKMRSATAIARFAILLIVSIGLFVLAYLAWTQPAYLDKLSQSDLGRKMVAYGIASEIVGLAWVGWTLKTEA